MPSSGVQTCALRSEEHTSELQSRQHLVCRLLLEKQQGDGTLLRAVPPYAPYRLPRSHVGRCGGRGRQRKEVLLPRRRQWEVACFGFFFLMIRRPPRSTLFPYTTSSDLWRSRSRRSISSSPRAPSLGIFPAFPP